MNFLYFFVHLTSSDGINGTEEHSSPQETGFHIRDTKRVIGNDTRNSTSGVVCGHLWNNPHQTTNYPRGLLAKSNNLILHIYNRVDAKWYYASRHRVPDIYVKHDGKLRPE